MAGALLINSNRLHQPWPVIPVGLCCVASALEEAGHTVRVLDLCFSRKCADDIAKAVTNFKPDVIGISVRNIDNATAYNTRFLLDKVNRRVIQPCKERFKGPIVIGGPAVGVSGPEMLSLFDLEYAVRGDGEAVFVEFVKRIEQRRSPDDLDGLIVRRNGEIVHDPPPHFVEDLDRLPFPRPHKYVDLRPYRRYDSPLQIQTKRGCALKCSYCTYNRIEGGTYRLREPERVAAEIEELVRGTGIHHIEFLDSTFNIPLDHTKAVLRSLIKKGLSLRLHTMGLNPSSVDAELVDLMAGAGFTEVDLGAEAGCDEILRDLAKNFATQDIVRAGRLLHDRKIPINWFLVVGAPAETRATIEQTLKTITTVASRWDLINVGIGLRAYKGAPIAEQLLRENPDCTHDAFLRPVHVEPRAIDLETMKTIVKIASCRHANIFMYDEDMDVPRTLVRIGAWLLGALAPRQPIWRLHILIRQARKLTGFTFLLRRRLERRLKSMTENSRLGCDTKPSHRACAGEAACSQTRPSSRASRPTPTPNNRA